MSTKKATGASTGREEGSTPVQGVAGGIDPYGVKPVLRVTPENDV